MRTCPTCQTAYPAETLVCPRDGSALPLGDDAGLAPPASGPANDPLLGTNVADRYRITRRIGEGGMGVVYAARQETRDQEVAIKVLHDKYAERPELAARLMNEAKLASSIHHPNIIDIFDFGETADGRAFVAMEFLEGESLAQLIRREGALPEERVLALGLQIASALGAAHDKGIIHRDMKPENVFLLKRDGEDFVKVVDFGISKNVRFDEKAGLPEPRLTQTGMILGTPLYMSPEQARGETDPDHRIDIYALGVILYESLTGEVPFRAANYLGIISQIVSTEPLSPRKVRPDLAISEACERMVWRALAKARDDRYPSMTEFSQDMARVRAGQAIGTLPLRATARRRSLAGGLGVMIGLALIVGIGVGTAWYANHRPHPPAPSTTAAAATPSPLPPESAPALASPSTTVIVKINSTPAGAEILDGARRLGQAPATIELARSNRPLRLTFRLNGYDDGETEVLPEIDGETINIELHPKRKHPAPPPRRAGNPARETAPNPY